MNTVSDIAKIVQKITDEDRPEFFLMIYDLLVDEDQDLAIWLRKASLKPIRPYHIAGSRNSKKRWGWVEYQFVIDLYGEGNEECCAPHVGPAVIPQKIFDRLPGKAIGSVKAYPTTKAAYKHLVKGLFNGHNSRRLRFDS